jgi:hypothetical protein
MADAPRPVVHIGENSPEHVAFNLFTLINASESHRDRAAVLDLYAECLDAVRDPDARLRAKKKK